MVDVRGVSVPVGMQERNRQGKASCPRNRDRDLESRHHTGPLSLVPRFETPTEERISKHDAQCSSVTDFTTENFVHSGLASTILGSIQQPTHLDVHNMQLHPRVFVTPVKSVHIISRPLWGRQF